MNKYRGKGLGIREWWTNFLRCCVFLLFAFLLAGCSSLIQKSGEFIEGSAFAERASAIYRTGGKKSESTELRELVSKEGEMFVEISSSVRPGFVLRGIDSNGNIELTEAHFLSSHVQGWNEFTIAIIGNAALERKENGEASLRITTEPERIQIISGKIRLKDNYLTGSAALSSLRNRRERILAIIEWMSQSSQEQIAFANLEEFEAYWKPRLFPELVSKGKRPPEYSAENAEWRRSDSVKWNQSYTKNVFPEELWELRNSGALLRDCEEAAGWIFMEYSWDTIIGSLNEITLSKRK